MNRFLMSLLFAAPVLAGDFTYNLTAAANRSNHDITHNLGSAGVVVQCTTIGGVAIAVSVPDANRTSNALRVTMPGAGGPFNGKCYISGGAGGATGGSTDLALTKTSGTVLSIAAGRYGINSDTYSMPATTFTLVSMPIVTVTSVNPVEFTLSNANYTLLVDGDSSMVTVTGGTGCSAVNGLHTILKADNGLFKVRLTPNVNATGCTGLTGNVAGTGTGTCYIEATDDGIVRARCPSASGVLLSCTGNCNFLQEAVPEFDFNNVKIGTVTLTAGTPATWNVTTDTREFLSNRRIIPGDLMQFDLTGTIMSATGNVARRNGGNVFTGSQDFTAATVLGISAGPGGSSGVLVDHLGVQSAVSYTAVTEATLSATSIPGGTLAAGECIQVEGFGYITTGTPSTEYRMYFGATSILFWTSASAGPHKWTASVCYNAGSTTDGMIYGFAETRASDGYLSRWRSSGSLHRIKRRFGAQRRIARNP